MHAQSAKVDLRMCVSGNKYRKTFKIQKDMTTKIMNMFNKMKRRGSGANLNLFRYAAMVLVLLLGVSELWGTTTYYYTKGSVSVKTGSGTVYINTASPATSGSSTTSSTAATKSCDKTSTQNAEQTYYISAVPATDWRFDSWTLSNWSTNPSSSTATTSGKIKAASSTESSPSTATAQASFKQISIASVTPTSVTLNPTDARTSCTDYTGKVTFTTTNDNASTQIGAPSFEKTGSGTWTASSSWVAGTSTVTYTFKGNGYYGGSGTASGSRNNSATLTLPTAGGTSSKSVTFTANFPSLVIADGETDVVSPKGPTDDGAGAVTFDVTFFDGLFDISSAVISNETGGTWTLGSMSYEQTNAATGAGVITVPFTFNAGGATGDFSAKLTITPATNTGASTKEVTLTAHVDALSSNDASVTPLGGSATEYATFAEALAAANAADGCTLKLLRDVEGITTSQEIKKTMTLDLNRYSLSGTLSSAGGLLKLNTVGKILTITDTQAGGKISVSGNIDGRIAAVDIQKGSLVLAKGDLLAQNANTGTTLANIYAAGVYLGSGTTMGMTGGSVTANRTGASGNYCFGIYCAGTGSSASSVTLTGGTVTATFPNGSYAEGIFAAGNSIISNMTVTASSKTTCYAVRVEDGQLAINGGTFTATTTAQEARGLYAKTAPSNKNAVLVNNATFNVTAGTSDAKGIWCRSTTTTMSGDPTDANVVLSGVTVNAKTDETTGSTDAYAIISDEGVVLGITNGTYNATAKTNTATALKSSGYTAVLGGTFNATATTTTARSLHVVAGIAAVKGGTFTATAETDLTNGADIESGAKLLAYGGTFKGHLNKIAASKYAIGANVKAGGTLEAQGGTFIGEAANTTLGAKQTSFACGVYGVDGNSTINMSNSTMRGELLSNYLSNGDASTWNGGAYGFYSRSTNPCGLTNCTINAVSAYQGGFGLRFANTPAEVRNCTVTVTTTYAYNYGIFTGGTCDLKVYNSYFNCTSGTTYGYGIYAFNGTTYAENCTINVTTQRTGATSAADCYLYGVNVNTGKTATLNGCTINATGSGQYSNNGYGVYVNGTADIENCKVTVSNINSGAYAIGNTSSTTRIGVASGKFKATATSTGISTNGTAAAAKQQLYGGYYNTKNNLEKYLPTGYGIETLPSSAPEYGEGYRYAIRSSANVDPVCKIGSTPYYTLEEALEYASKNASSSNKLIILMTANYTLPAGNYTLPQYTTLIVPYDGQTSAMGTTINSSLRSNTRTNPSVNLKLTFATGANLTAFGTIETGGREYDANGGTQTGGVNGKFGQIALNSGSHIDLENGSKLQCWGYITGAGTITAKSGSEVYEHFEFGVNKGGTIMSGLISNNKGVFAVDDYFYQNIEAEITYKPGSQAFASSGMYIQGNRAANGVKMVGSSNEHLFKMSTDEVRPNMWVRKKYDPTTDRCTWTLNDGAQFSSINITISGYGMNSSNFVLPIASSMDIVMNYGTLAISSTQKVMLMPGSRMIIKKDATLQIPSGTKFYVWDVAQWNLGHPVAQYVYSAAYQPTRSTNPRSGLLKDKTNLPSGEIYVQGTLEVSGDLQTTNGGAYIHSTNEDAGQIVYKTNATASGTVYQYTTGGNYTASSTTSAKLQNGDGTYEETAGSVTNDKWIYRDNKWVKVSTSGCFVVETISGTPHYYAHPKDWVEVTANTPDDHAYHVTADPTRFVIQGADCNWIEVVKDGSDYKCINENSIYYGSYFEWSESNGYWVEKKVSISFNNQGTITTYNNIPYKTVPQYAGATPTKSGSSTEYFTWIGWLKDDSEEGEFFAKDTELPFATENTTYYAVFEKHKYSYAVVFKNYDGSVLQTSSWEAGQVPYYLAETDPVKPATAAKIYTFTGWSPATFSAVTGTGQVYTAQFAESDRTYTVQWVNYNGTVLKEEQVVYGDTPSEPATPTRPNDSYYTYTFDAWSPAVSAVTGNQTYTATYNYEKKVTKYAITFKNGSTTVYTQNLKDGETPAFDGTTPTKAADAQYTYTFDGWSETDGGAVLASLPAVSGAAKTYYAHFATTTNAYTIRWKSIDGKQLYETDENVLYGVTPEYNSSKPTKARQGATVYTFDGWSSSVGGDKIALPSVTSDATYYAHFTDDPVYTVTFDANGHGTAPAAQEVVKNQQVIEPEAPAVAEWIFGGWYKEAGCTNAWNFASDVITADRTLYAKWTLAVATVTANNVTENYASITEAFTTAKAKTNPTIKLLQDVSMGATTLTYDGANTCTLDLNGNEISGTARILFKVDNANAVFTVTDLTESKLGKLSLSTAPTDKAGYCANLVNGTLKLEAGTFYIRSTSSNQNAVGARVDGGEFIMNGGTVHTVVTVSSRVGHGVQPLGTANAIVNGGTVHVESAGQGYGMYVSGTMTVNGGKFHITAASTAEVAHSNASPIDKLFINGGYYNINNNLSKCVPSPYHVLPASLTDGGLTYNFKVAEAYTVTFKDGDNNTIQSGLVEKNAIPVYSGATPTKTATAEFTYSFNNSWSPAISAVTAAATYTAQFNSTVNSYEITWLNDDNSLIDKTTVEYGVVPTHADATKENTAEYTYMFTGWDNTPVAVTGTATYKAKFSQTKNTYTVTWKNEDGTPLETDENVEYGVTPTYNGATPTKAADEEYTYTFNGWTPAVGTITGTTEYTATYTSTPNVASVTINEVTTYYTDFSTAWTAANNSATYPSTIKMLQEVSLGATSVTYSGSKNCTLDLNGQTISGTSNLLLIIDNASANFTISDNTESKLGKLSMNTSSTAGAAFCAQLKKGKLYLEAGTIYLHTTSAEKNAVGVRVDDGEFIMNGGTVHTVATQNNITAHGVQPLNKAKATINGGTVRAESANGYGSGMYVTGTITVTGGKFYVTGKTAYIVHSGTTDPTKVKIQGGYYNTDSYLSGCIVAHYRKKALSDTHPEYANGYRYTVDNAYIITWELDGVTVREDEMAYGDTPNYGETPTKPSDEQYDYSFSGWTPQITTVTGDKTYSGSFNANTHYYTITWKNYNGDVLETDTGVEGEMQYGATPSYNGATPTKTGDGKREYTFKGWSPEVASVSGDQEYIAQYSMSIDIDGVNEELDITTDDTTTTTTVHVAGRLMVSSGSLTTNELILEGTPTSSGEIIGNVDVTQNAYFDFSQSGGFKAKTWYAVAVPWQVDVPANELGSVYTKKGTGDYVQQRLGRTYDLIYYDGARRAGGDTKAWNYVEEDPAAEHIMVPGRAYMIYLTSDADVIRFKKSASAELHTDEVAVVKHSSGLGAIYADWNGIANPATYKAKLNVGTTDDKGQVYNPVTKGYDWFYLNSQQLQVGQPVFVQPIAAKTVEAERVNPSSPAPRRSAEWSAPLSRYEINLAPTDEEVSDRIIVRMDEEKEEDAYIVGQDLVKMGVSNLVPQMWINRYDSKISINTMAPVNNTADYPLGISVQKDGEYDLFIADQPEDNSTLYLTYDGMAIWNLNYGGYVAYLNKGTDTHYGLRIVKKTRPIVTGIEDATIQNGDAIRKVLVNDQVYIIRNNEVYTVDGQMVK